MNEKLSIATLDDGTRAAVLYLNGSSGLLPKPRENLLTDLFDTLELPVYQGGHQLLNIDPRYINEILGIEHPTPEQEAKLTAALLSQDIADIAISAGLVPARGIQLSVGRIPMAAALVNFADHPDVLATYHLPTRLLIITDRPLN